MKLSLVSPGSGVAAVRCEKTRRLAKPGAPPDCLPLATSVRMGSIGNTAATIVET